MEHLCRRREQIEAREKRVLGEMPIATCLDRLEHGGTTACLPAEGLSASPRALVPRMTSKRDGNRRPCRV